MDNSKYTARHLLQFQNRMNAQVNSNIYQRPKIAAYADVSDENNPDSGNNNKPNNENKMNETPNNKMNNMNELQNNGQNRMNQMPNGTNNMNELQKNEQNRMNQMPNGINNRLQNNEENRMNDNMNGNRNRMYNYDDNMNNYNSNRMNNQNGGGLATPSLAMAYVMYQPWGDLYEPAEALHRGTLFRQLDMPFYGWRGNV